MISRRFRLHWKRWIGYSKKDIAEIERILKALINSLKKQTLESLTPGILGPSSSTKLEKNLNFGWTECRMSNAEWRLTNEYKTHPTCRNLVTFKRVVMVYISTNNFGMGRIAALRHPMPLSSYAISVVGDGCMPAFSNPPHPSNRRRNLPQLLNVTGNLDSAVIVVFMILIVGYKMFSLVRSFWAISNPAPFIILHSTLWISQKCP